MSIKHLAIIMDGNRRWALSKNLKAYEGHIEGANNLSNIIKCVDKKKINFLTVFVFSTENWKRSKSEISFLMDLLVKFLDGTIKKINTNDYKVRFIGNLEPFKKNIIKKINFIQDNTCNNKGLTINIALNFGGRYDIINATNKILNTQPTIKVIDEENFQKFTCNNSIPDPDLLIRTGGEMRLSNFLLWNLAYTELMFVSQMWPEFDDQILDECIINYKNRIRNYGE
ncbi:polyprenyl diphosphate synthase [Alphaproteobacteria bacterium]|nr:polyprenyl diphosphate synthase [Alphaproteobacteria bacterium]